MNVPPKLTPVDLFSKLTTALPEGAEILLRSTIGEPHIIEIRLDTLELSKLSEHTRAELNGVLGEAGASPTFWGESADWHIAIKARVPSSPHGEATAWLVLSHRPPDQPPDEQGRGSNAETAHPEA